MPVSFHGNITAVVSGNCQRQVKSSWHPSVSAGTRSQLKFIVSFFFYAITVRFPIGVAKQSYRPSERVSLAFKTIKCRQETNVHFSPVKSTSGEKIGMK